MLRFQDPELEKLLSFLARQENFVFLDTSNPDHENVESFLFLEPVERMICRAGDDLENYLTRLQQHLAKGYYLAGWVGYEFGVMLEGKIGGLSTCSSPSNLVLADLGVFLKPYRFDHYTGQNNFPFETRNKVTKEKYTISALRPNMLQEEFIEGLDHVQQYIVAGDTYQVNYTMKLLFDFEGSAEKLYFVLRKNQSVAYSAYIKNGKERILSFSPELFFRKKGDEITVRPMKGTARKGKNSWEEELNRTELHHDIKNRSENVMIVDLLRNDLARLMHGHGESSVFVDSLFDVESYESLLQMTSTIKAQSAPEAMSKLKLTELFRALFPCGSITGAPKIRTMQIINELEKEQRGVYTGAIGYFGPDGSAVFNVPIRTIRLDQKRGEMGIGAGITHDSVPEDEWKESLLKGRFLTHSQPDFQLFETMLWRPGSGYWLLEQHLERLADGARFFKFSCDLGKIRERLSQQETHSEESCRRVRLVLEKDGRILVTAVSCAEPQVTGLPVYPEKQNGSAAALIDFSSHKIDSGEPWPFYKTTRRRLYDEEYERAREKGLFDLIFCNQRGEVTEGCITNIIIYSKGQYRTPPVASGLLPGVMRNYLIEEGAVDIAETVLSMEDVRSAEAIYLCNSVRGLVQVHLVPS